MSIEFKQIVQIIFDKVSHWFTVGIKMLPNIGVAILLAITFYFLGRLGRYAVRKIDKHTEGESALVQLLANLVYILIRVCQ